MGESKEFDQSIPISDGTANEHPVLQTFQIIDLDGCLNFKEFIEFTAFNINGECDHSKAISEFLCYISQNQHGFIRFNQLINVAWMLGGDITDEQIGEIIKFFMNPNSDEDFDYEELIKTLKINND
ncbi:calmodulin-like protein 1 [Teleopsis dalmanni]|uniref:calmodulin-like protein 1 n=1 Tax=Teleopsis dalmanni TaxID=139649 RepID=UPI000D32B3FB|nr:calmodulin-like protein 1 [Teleopsis dalmanni]